MKLKHIAVCAVLALAGCAGTSVRNGTGRTLLHTQANVAGLNYSYSSGTENIHLTAASLDHSTATTAGGNAFAKGVQSVGTAAVAVGTAVATSGITSAAKP